MISTTARAMSLLTSAARDTFSHRYLCTAAEDQRPSRMTVPTSCPAA